jgi:hypothetical protein
VPQGKPGRAPDRAGRVEPFDRATERQRARDASREEVGSAMARGWRRDELYERGVAG